MKQIINQQILDKIGKLNQEYNLNIIPKNKNIVGIGKRGVVIKLDSENCLKISKGISFLKREFICLKQLNKHGIGPKAKQYFEDYDAFIMEYLKGQFFKQFLNKENSKTKILKIIYEIMDQLFTLDDLCLTKEEMHKPVKHIIIRKNKPYLIDFERCKPSNKPSNLSQFLQYLSSISEILSEKRLILIRDGQLENIRKYKKDICKKNLTKIKSLLWFYPETDFEKIYTLVRNIPIGKLATYAQIGKIVNVNPRIVGFAMNKNPLWPIVPCHRVVAKDSLGGFSKGLEAKKKLLKKEGIKNFDSNLSQHIIDDERLKKRFTIFLNKILQESCQRA